MERAWRCRCTGLESDISQRPVIQQEAAPLGWQLGYRLSGIVEPGPHWSGCQQQQDERTHTPKMTHDAAIPLSSDPHTTSVSLSAKARQGKAKRGPLVEPATQLFVQHAKFKLTLFRFPCAAPAPGLLAGREIPLPCRPATEPECGRTARPDRGRNGRAGHCWKGSWRQG